MKLYEPKPGGWSRLSAKLAEYDREQSREVMIWRGAAAAMIALVVIVSAHRPPAATLEDKSVNATVEMAGTPANVHYYWVIQ